MAAKGKIKSKDGCGKNKTNAAHGFVFFHCHARAFPWWP
jgi:hypothetical protein